MPSIRPMGTRRCSGDLEYAATSSLVASGAVIALTPASTSAGPSSNVLHCPQHCRVCMNSHRLLTVTDSAVDGPRTGRLGLRRRKPRLPGPAARRGHPPRHRAGARARDGGADRGGGGRVAAHLLQLLPHQGRRDHGGYAGPARGARHRADAAPPPDEDPWASLEAVLTDRLQGREAARNSAACRRARWAGTPGCRRASASPWRRRTASPRDQGPARDRRRRPWPQLVVSVAFAVVRAVPGPPGDAERATCRTPPSAPTSRTDSPWPAGSPPRGAPGAAGTRNTGFRELPAADGNSQRQWPRPTRRSGGWAGN